MRDVKTGRYIDEKPENVYVKFVITIKLKMKLIFFTVITIMNLAQLGST